MEMEHHLFVHFIALIAEILQVEINKMDMKKNNKVKLVISPEPTEAKNCPTNALQANTLN